jgi:alcohol dehydrogenase (cytochrome c)
VHDWDGNQTSVLIEGTIGGKKHKLLVTAQRNAFYYVLDRDAGEFLNGRAFAKQTWAKGLDDRGWPIVLPDTTPPPAGNYVCPDASGATNWGSPSYDPGSNLFIVSVREACAVYTSVTKDPIPGQGFTGGGQEVDPKVGTLVWRPQRVSCLHHLTMETSSRLKGVRRYLWHYYTGANIIASPVSYAVDGKQHVAIASQSAILVFALQ